MRAPQSAPQSHTPPPAQTLHAALSAVLQPLACLAVAQGLAWPALADLLKHSLVRAALQAQPTGAGPRAVSRVALGTGLHRREVRRLLQSPAQPAPRRTVAAELFARWVTDPVYRTQRGQPRVLPRLGPAPSFEALAASVTRDVHPRSLLDELIRLGLAEEQVTRQRVRLLKQAFVPHGDTARMLEWLGDNVGDHLRAAVSNVLGHDGGHFEQAIFADELSESSLLTLRTLVQAHWRTLSADLVPAITALIAQDRAAQRPTTRRVRIGLYTFTDLMEPDTGSATVGPSRADTARPPPRS